MQQYGNNGRPYDQNRDSLRSSGSSQRTTPPNDGASDTSRYGFNGEPLSRPPARTANGTVRRTRTDNSIEFPTQPRPVRDTGSTARRPAGQRSTAQRPRSSGGQNRRPAQRPANRNGRPAQNSRSAARLQQQGQGYNKNQKLRPAPQRDAQRREGRKKRRLTRAAIRRRRRLRRLATFGLLLCVIGIGMYLTVTMLFRISAIQVQTADGTQVTEIAGYSADSILQTLGVQVEENIFSFDSGAKAAELERQYPLLESIRVVRDYPNTVVGGGIGTAPMFQLTRELAAAGVKPDVFFGFRDTPYCMEEYRSIANLVKVSTDTGAVGFHGFVTQLYDPADYDVVLVCGPTVMMKNAARLCAEKGTPCFVSMEKKMACGIGACLGCTCETKGGEGKSVCKNGPVFDATEVFF